MINGLKVTEIPLVRMQLESHKKKLREISTRKLPLMNKSPQHQYNQTLFKDNTSKETIKNRSTSLSLSKYNFFASLSLSQTQRLHKLKQNHLKSYSYHKIKKQMTIEHQNSMIFQKLIHIQQRTDPNNPSAKKLVPNKSIDTTQIVQSQQENSSNQVSVRKQKRKMAKDFIYRKKQSLAIQATNVEIGKRIMNSTAYYNHQKDIENFTKTRQIINRLGKFQIVKRLMNKSAKRSKTLPNKLPKIYSQQSQIL